MHPTVQISSLPALQKKMRNAIADVIEFLSKKHYEEGDDGTQLKNLKKALEEVQNEWGARINESTINKAIYLVYADSHVKVRLVSVHNDKPISVPAHANRVKT